LFLSQHHLNRHQGNQANYFHFTNISLFCSEKDTDILKSCSYFLSVILKVHNEYDEDFLVNMIKLVLCTLSNKVFPRDVMNKIINSLENYLHQISCRICKNVVFSTYDKKSMHFEIQVCICIYGYAYIACNVF